LPTDGSFVLAVGDCSSLYTADRLAFQSDIGIVTQAVSQLTVLKDVR
jgi:hypothetical protein